MQFAITLFSILTVLGTTSAQAQGGHKHGHKSCGRPRHPRPSASSISANSTLSDVPTATSSATSIPAITESSASANATTTASDSPSDITLTGSTFPAFPDTTSSEAGSASSSSAVASGTKASDPISESESFSISSIPSSAQESLSSTSQAEGTSSIASSPGAVLAPTGTPSPRVSASTTASASSSVVPITSPPSTGGDKGVGLGVNGDTGPVSAFTGSGSTLSWYYNWALDSNSDSAGLEFVPMVWGEASVSGVKASAAKWKAQGVTHVLGFNEPDMGSNVGGSNIGAAKAATLHQQWVKDLGGQYLIGSPAVARGSKKWMDDWLAACAGNCIHDFVPFHFYGTNVDQLIDYVEEFSAAYNKPLWLTEWACHDYSSGDICDADEVEAFMKTAISYFKESGLVERWAWFGAFPNMASNGNANGIMNLDGSINAVGKYYLSL